MKKLSSIIIIGLLVFGLVFFYQYYVSALNYSYNPDSDDRIVINIEKGSLASDVADLLAEKGLIKSPLIFKLYLKQNNLAGQIKAGRMVLKESLNLKQIVGTLIEGRGEELTVTILEGWTLQQIADHLEGLDLTKSDDFLSCLASCTFEFDFLPDGYLEGYLYPDTYFVDINTFSDQRFISRTIQTLENRLSDEDWEAIKNSARSLEEIMIMASIVEREERDPDEQPTVAGILWDRFDNEVGLGADATVLYALGRTKGGLTYDDLQVDSPYNTRRYRGLPPTPISNPGISSIRAALYPKKTSYFYYLHDPDGEVHYAETLDQHNANKRKYL